MNAKLHQCFSRFQHNSLCRMDIDYSPTGREFVTGSYDRTVRIFDYNAGHSREVYHTKRMQRQVVPSRNLDQFSTTSFFVCPFPFFPC